MPGTPVVVWHGSERRVESGVTRSTVYNETTYGATVFEQERARGRNRAPSSSCSSSPVGVARPSVRTFAVPPIPRLPPTLQSPCGLVHAPMHATTHARTHSHTRPLLYQSGYARWRCTLSKLCALSREREHEAVALPLLKRGGGDRGNEQRGEQS